MPSPRTSVVPAAACGRFGTHITLATGARRAPGRRPGWIGFAGIVRRRGDGGVMARIDLTESTVDASEVIGKDCERRDTRSRGSAARSPRTVARCSCSRTERAGASAASRGSAGAASLRSRRGPGSGSLGKCNEAGLTRAIHGAHLRSEALRARFFEPPATLASAIPGSRPGRTRPTQSGGYARPACDRTPTQRAEHEAKRKELWMAREEQSAEVQPIEGQREDGGGGRTEGFAKSTAAVTGEGKANQSERAPRHQGLPGSLRPDPRHERPDGPSWGRP